MIWKHSLPGERFLEFVSEYEPVDWIVFFIQCKDKKIPHMSACHESRAVAREEYVEVPSLRYRLPAHVRFAKVGHFLLCWQMLRRP